MFAFRQAVTRTAPNSLKNAQKRLFNTDSSVETLAERFGVLMDRLGVPKEKYSQQEGVQTVSPLTGEVLATIEADDSKQVAEKAKKASEAAKQWNKYSPEHRIQYNDILAGVLEERADDHKELLSIVTAKPKAHVEGEVDEAAAIARGASNSYKSYLKHQDDSKIVTPDGKETITHKHDATGTYAMPGAYNFPFLISGGLLHTPPVMVSGGASVVAPNPTNSVMSLAVEKVFEESSKRFEKKTGKKVPDGIVGFVHGREASEKLVNDENIDGGIVFTGSSSVDDKLSELAHKKKLKYIGEGGGNNPIVVTSDVCNDNDAFENAMQKIGKSFTSSGGQICASLSRLYVPEEHINKVTGWLKNYVDDVKENHLGDPANPKTVVSGQMSADNTDKLEEYVKKAKEQGDEVYGAEKINAPGAYKGGSFMSPGFIVRKDSKITDEPFGPITNIFPYKDVNAALEQANQWGKDEDGNIRKTGLTAGVFTLDESVEKDFQSKVKAGVSYKWREITGLPVEGAFGPYGNRNQEGGRAAGVKGEEDANKSFVQRYMGPKVTEVAGEPPAYRR